MAGTYTEIKAIYAPPVLDAGFTFPIEVEVKNLYEGENAIYVDGEVNGNYLAFGGYYYTVPPFGIMKFQDYFVMPNKSITIKVVSWYYGGGRWNYDDEASVRIKLATIPEEQPPAAFTGEITEVALKPGASAQDARFLISFKASAKNWWDAYGGWFTRLTMTLGPYGDSDDQQHIGMDGSRARQELSLGTIQPGSYTAVVKLEGAGRVGAWQLLDTYSAAITILKSGEITPPSEEKVEPKEGISMALPLAVGGGLLLVALMTPKKK